MEIQDKAIVFINTYKSWDEHDESKAVRAMDYQHAPLSTVAPNIYDNIQELLDEFGNDNDLEEDWWYEYGDAEDWFFLIKN